MSKKKHRKRLLKAHNELRTHIRQELDGHNCYIVDRIGNAAEQIEKLYDEHKVYRKLWRTLKDYRLKLNSNCPSCRLPLKKVIKTRIQIEQLYLRIGRLGVKEGLQ